MKKIIAAIVSACMLIATAVPVLAESVVESVESAVLENATIAEYLGFDEELYEGKWVAIGDEWALYVPVGYKNIETEDFLYVSMPLSVAGEIGKDLKPIAEFFEMMDAKNETILEQYENEDKSVMYRRYEIRKSEKDVSYGDVAAWETDGSRYMAMYTFRDMAKNSAEGRNIMASISLAAEVDITSEESRE